MGHVCDYNDIISLYDDRPRLWSALRQLVTLSPLISQGVKTLHLRHGDPKDNWRINQPTVTTFYAPPGPVEVDLADSVPADGVDLPVGGGHGGRGPGVPHWGDLLPLVGQEAVALSGLKYSVIKKFCIFGYFVQGI